MTIKYALDLSVTVRTKQPAVAETLTVVAHALFSKLGIAIKIQPTSKSTKLLS